MSLKILVENGSWQPVHNLTTTPSSEHSPLISSFDRANSQLRQSLGLRQDPLETRINKGELEIRARGIAGTLSVNNCLINIAPKFIPQAVVEDKWSLSLLMLIRYARPRHVAFNQSSHLSSEQLNFVDLLAMAYIDAVQAGLRDQVIQTYQIQEMSLSTMRGRLNMQRQIRSVFKRPHLVECDVDQLDKINPYNNLLKWGAQVFATTVHTVNLRRRINELFNKLPGTPNPALAKTHAILKPPHQYRIWQPALDICSMLISGQAHTNNYGNHHGYSFVFNMERLFENFVENILARVVTRYTTSVLKSQRQVSVLYAHSHSMVHRDFYSKPDNLLSDENQAVAVVDAKYKRLTDSDGVKNKKPQSQDIYELVAAMTAHGCKAGILIYPKVTGDAGLEDEKLHIWHINAFGEKLIIGAIALDLMKLSFEDGAKTLEQNLAVAIDDLLRKR